jgi:hypothetical protein
MTAESGNRRGRKERVCGQIGTKQMAEVLGERMLPPAERA